MPLVSAANRLQTAAQKLAALPSSLLFALFFLAVAISHLTLLHLPYFWDEGGYYIPAALDFFHTGQLVPHFTNAHPPIPNIVLGTLWHIVGVHILATRLAITAIAASALLAIFRLAQRLTDAVTAVTLTLLVAVYPIWFAQSTLAHADIFAAAFTLWAFALYLPTEICHPDPELVEGEGLASGTVRKSYVLIAVLFSLAALSKETAIVQPAALATLQLVYLTRDRRSALLRRKHLLWIATFAVPVIPLILWYIYHHHITGFTFGNPEYLRYNATANLTAGHIFQATRYRFLHLFWQRNIWLPIVLAIACLFLPRRTDPQNSVILSEGTRGFMRVPQSKGPDAIRAATTASPLLTRHLHFKTLQTITFLIAANWIFFSVLGGALLTRYLLPVYPLILLVCIDAWRSRTHLWPIFALATAGAFLSALWINPPTSFAPEDTLTYRDMIVVHQEAIDFVAQHYPQSTVLTAWPVAADLFNPYLGYVATPIKATSIEDFTLPSIRKAAQEPGDYDTAIVFTTHFVTPPFRHYLLAHPNSRRGREFAATRDLTPNEIAAILGGTIVWQDDRNGEWAAVLRFNRSYEAILPSSHMRNLYFPPVSFHKNVSSSAVSITN
jgi:4-amino-4-deoxy-L-arabinose transferase-like glycosyltransferase